jgi:16S rRNA (guanine527-N7)-methyltransferase
VTEDEARARLRDRYGAGPMARLERYVAALLAANRNQNLISRASESAIWGRHILDSAQLADHAPNAESWLDIGSGAGLPGIVLAIVTDRPILLVEPRRKRAEFLTDMVEHLALPSAAVRQAMIERVTGQTFAAVVARAYAALPAIFQSTIQLTTSSTIWILPKGRGAEQELAAARQAWQGVFHVEQSLTDPDARIVVATGVRPR